MRFHTIQIGRFIDMFLNGYKKYGGSPKMQCVEVLTIQFDSKLVNLKMEYIEKRYSLETIFWLISIH